MSSRRSSETERFERFFRLVGFELVDLPWLDDGAEVADEPFYSNSHIGELRENGRPILGVTPMKGEALWKPQLRGEASRRCLPSSPSPAS
jgi:hypothetical protein